MNLIETLKTSIYTTKQHQQHETTFLMFTFFQKSIFFKIRSSAKSVFYADFMAQLLLTYFHSFHIF